MYLEGAGFMEIMHTIDYYCYEYYNMYGLPIILYIANSTIYYIMCSPMLML